MALAGCGNEASWSTSVMVDGIEPPVSAEEISTALDAIATEPGLSVETSLLLPDGGDTEWRVLAGDAGHLFLGIGAWTDEGPSQDPDDRGQHMSLELEGGTWVWCASTTLTVGANEFACTSSRDPTPFLRTPTGRLTVVRSDRGSGLRLRAACADADCCSNILANGADCD